jgi:hypothetical protein
MVVYITWIRRQNGNQTVVILLGFLTLPCQLEHTIPILMYAKFPFLEGFLFRRFALIICLTSIQGTGQRLSLAEPTLS